jgi:hypothetical protein
MTRENRRRLPNRRETLGALGAAGGAAWLGWRANDRPIAIVNASSATCVQTPQGGGRYQVVVNGCKHLAVLYSTPLDSPLPSKLM